MIIYDRTGRKRRVSFGREVRGLDIEELILEHDDLSTMLSMNPTKLKDSIYTIMCSMRQSENYHHNQGSRYETDDSAIRNDDDEFENQVKIMREQMFYTEQKENAMPSYALKPLPYTAPVISVDGLLWTDEEEST